MFICDSSLILKNNPIAQAPLATLLLRHHQESGQLSQHSSCFSECSQLNYKDHQNDFQSYSNDCIYYLKMNLQDLKDVQLILVVQFFPPFVSCFPLYALSYGEALLQHSPHFVVIVCVTNCTLSLIDVSFMRMGMSVLFIVSSCWVSRTQQGLAKPLMNKLMRRHLIKIEKLHCSQALPLTTKL